MPRSALVFVTVCSALALAALAGCSSDGGGEPVPTSTAASTGAAGDGGTTAAFATPGAATGTADQLVGKCKTCHGNDLSGATTPLAGYPEGVSLYAPNLTPDKETGIGGWTDSQLGVAIRQGLDKDGMILCPQMRHYPDLTTGDLDTIIKALRATPAVKKAVPGSVCPPLKR